MENEITHIRMGDKTYPIGKRVQYKYVTKDRIPALMELNPERVVFFMDDDGVLYVVNQGDLDTYWLRKNQTEIQPKKEREPNEFLEKNTFDLF